MGYGNKNSTLIYNKIGTPPEATLIPQEVKNVTKIKEAIKMDDDGINYRFLSLEKENEERKKENEERCKSDKATSEKIVAIEKISIIQDSKLNIIMGTLKVISGTFAAFVVTNFMMYLISTYGKK